MTNNYGHFESASFTDLYYISYMVKYTTALNAIKKKKKNIFLLFCDGSEPLPK